MKHGSGKSNGLHGAVGTLDPRSMTYAWWFWGYRGLFDRPAVLAGERPDPSIQ